MPRCLHEIGLYSKSTEYSFDGFASYLN